MNKIKILKISEFNQEKLISFYKETFEEIGSYNSDYKWRYRFDNKLIEPLIATENSEIIGHVGCYPTKFKINNIKLDGVWWSDVFVKKEHRGKGVAQLISKNLMNLSHFHTAICNEKSFKLLKKIGWCEAPTHFRLVKFVPLSNLLIFKNKSEFKEIELNEKNISQLSYLIKESNKLKKDCFIRDDAWFEWRFLKYPNRNRLVFLKSEKNYIIGLRTKWRKINIFKVLLTNNKLDKNLKNMLTIWCQKNKFIFFSFLEKIDEDNSSYFLGKKLKYLSHSNFKEFKNNFTTDFDDVQFADSDIGF